MYTYLLPTYFLTQLPIIFYNNPKNDLKQFFILLVKKTTQS
jgi:hypothetical protein